jgi:CO/xanthine dehydrogenase Mo-binding subunit
MSRPTPAVEPVIDHSYFAEDAPTDLHSVGASVPRGDARGHVTGQTDYFEDVQLRDPSDLLHLKMYRSERDHAPITGVDLTAALAVPGVVRILTHEDVPNNWYTILRLIGVEPLEEPVLAEGRVLFRGEQICAVLAETEAAAIEGAAKVKVDYEDLPPVFDIDEALEPDSVKIKPHGQNYFVYDDAAQPGGSGDGHHCRRVRFGDVEAAFAEADHVFEFEYQSSPIEHAPLEMTGCVVVPDSDGRLTIYSDTQACFFTLDNTALIMEEPFQRFRVIGGTVGGGFGGKVDVITEPIACIAADVTGRPVKYVYSRAEEMQVSSPRAAERIVIKDGVNGDGQILARKVTIRVDAGAYSRHSPYGTTKAAAHMPGPYSVPNVWVDAQCVYTNRPPSSAMRGFGVTIADFALESQMDRVAKALDIDPMQFRLINAYRDGDMKAHRQVVDDAALIEVIQKTAQMTGHDLPGEFGSMSSIDRSSTDSGGES